MEIENSEFAGFNTLPVEGWANYPVMPAHHGDLSSREGAAVAGLKRGRIWGVILQALTRGPNNPDAIAEQSGEAWPSVRKRLYELAAFNAVERTGRGARSLFNCRQGIYALSAGPLDADTPESVREAHEDAVKLAKALGTIVSGNENN